MRKTIPRVVYSVLGDRFYVVLRYRLTTVRGTRVQMIANEKYDVTEDVLRAVADRQRERGRVARRRARAHAAPSSVGRAR